MIQDKDIELIEKYFSDDLSEEEKEEYNTKLQNDKVFSEEVEFRKNLREASEQIVTAEFKAIFNKIHTDSENKRKKKKKIYMYSAISVSAAAIALLFFFIGNPLGNNRNLEGYIAMAGSSAEISILNLSGVSLKSEESIQASQTTNISVAFIESTRDNVNYNKYFFSNDILYLFTQPKDKVSIAYKVDTEGQRIYYMCRNSIVFSFRKSEQDKLFELNPVKDKNLGDFCAD